MKVNRNLRMKAKEMEKAMSNNDEDNVGDSTMMTTLKVIEFKV